MREKLRPMLATQGEPFDSPEHLFEVKWNGVRRVSRSRERPLQYLGSGHG